MSYKDAWVGTLSGLEPMGNAASHAVFLLVDSYMTDTDPEGQWLSAINICESFLLFPIHSDSPQTAQFQTHTLQILLFHGFSLEWAADPIIC